MKEFNHSAAADNPIAGLAREYFTYPSGAPDYIPVFDEILLFNHIKEL